MRCSKCGADRPEVQWEGEACEECWPFFVYVTPGVDALLSEDDVMEILQSQREAITPLCGQIRWPLPSVAEMERRKTKALACLLSNGQSLRILPCLTPAGDKAVILAIPKDVRDGQHRVSRTWGRRIDSTTKEKENDHRQD
jgi:hypothetical protein